MPSTVTNELLQEIGILVCSDFVVQRLEEFLPKLVVLVAFFVEAVNNSLLDKAKITLCFDITRIMKEVFRFDLRGEKYRGHCLQWNQTETCRWNCAWYSSIVRRNEIYQSSTAWDQTLTTQSNTPPHRLKRHLSAVDQDFVD